MAPTRPSKERAQCGAVVFLVVGGLMLAALLSFEVLVIRASDHGAAVEHLASSEEFARGTNAHVDFERSVAEAQGIGAGGSPALSTAQQQRLKALGFSAQQVVAMGSMTEAQVAAEILKAVESAETRSTTTAAAAVSAPAATAAVATEEDPLDAAYAAMAATAAEVRARNSLTTVPFPGKLNEELIRTLRPPPFCYTAVNGEPAEPCVSKFKQAPSDKVAMKIAQWVAEERPCWIFNRKCARMNFTDTTGKPYWQKFNKHWELHYLESQPPRALSLRLSVADARGWGGRGIHTQTADQTLEDLLPNIPDHADGSLGTCAVVGNADNLLGKGWGAQIDAHDFVVRYNVEIKGFEKDVGSKRNGIWTKINYERAAPGKEPTDYHMIPKFVPKGLEPIRGKPIMVYGPALPRWREVARDVYTVYKADRKITKGSPTGGWARMVSLAESGLCSRLDIYGFSSGGGKYFKRTQVVKEAHVIQVEHYTRRLMMALGVKGKVCVYGQ